MHNVSKAFKDSNCDFYTFEKFHVPTVPPADVDYRRGEGCVGGSEFYMPGVAGRGCEEVAPLVF